MKVSSMRSRTAIRVDTFATPASLRFGWSPAPGVYQGSRNCDKASGGKDAAGDLLSSEAYPDSSDDGHEHNDRSQPDAEESCVVITSVLKRDPLLLPLQISIMPKTRAAPPA
jgi:hypothetical protein